MKKPSERIQEIIKEKDLGYVQAILDYLDEEYERNKPKESKGCKKCGFSTEIGSDGVCWSSECKGK